MESRLPAAETVRVSQEAARADGKRLPINERQCGMTFTEAAAQVLRLVGKPLHYKEITDVAIEKDLLSHVGKSPEVTMGARLAALVKKGDKDNPLVRVKPGVFALREWDQATIDKGLADRTPALQRILELAAEPEKVVPVAVIAPEVAEAIVAEEPESADEEDAPRPARDELERAEIAAEADAIFAPEDDDDEPLIGAADEDEVEAGDRDNGGKRRRRRKRRGRGGDEGRDDDLPGYTVSDAPVDGIDLADLDIKEPTAGREREPERSRDQERSRGRESSREQERSRGREQEQERSRGREQEQERSRGREQEQERSRARDQDQDRNRGRERGTQRTENGELMGVELADALAKILASTDKGGAMGLPRLAELAQRRERLLVGEGQRASTAVIASLRLDNQRRMLEGRRPRFRLSENRVALVESMFDSEMSRLDNELTSLLDRYAEVSRRSLLRKLQDLSHRALGELVLLVLERVGVRGITSIRRPGTHGAEMHLAGQMQTAGGSIPTAIVIRRDGREVGRERVTELRGALHHYSAAASGWVITTGQVLSGAREEASVSGAAPVALTDGQALVRLCEGHGIGMTRVPLQIPMPDMELLDLLRS